MEVPAPDLPNAYSKMLDMYPNVPENVVKMYVQEYSGDLEKCSQMLNMMHLMYTDIQTLPAMGNPTDPEPENIPHSNPDSLCDNYTEATSPKSDSSSNGFAHSDFINQNSYINNANNAETIQCAADRKPGTVMDTSSSNVNSSTNLSKTVNFSKPLELHINIEEENDSLHSWRPNLSNNLCPDFFLPSLMAEDFPLNGPQASNGLNLNLEPSVSQVEMGTNNLRGEHWNLLEQNVSQVEMNTSNPRGEHWNLEQNVSQVKINTNNLHGEHQNCDLPRQMFHGYFPNNENAFEINFESHLHFQKCQMNAIKYEVIKAKIELGELKESVEKLSHELEMKSKAETLQDIEQLNDEIIQLRLECQNLCSEVDFYNKDKGLLGETDESFYSDQNDIAKVKSNNLEDNNDQHSSSDPKNEKTEQLQLWQCPKCTFDNHPAVSVCEMCRQGERSTRKPSRLRTPPHSPKKGSLPIFS